MSLWPPGEPAGLPVWLWGEARASLPWLCGCRWLMHTPVSSAASHLSGHGDAGGQTGFYRKPRCPEKQWGRFELTKSCTLPESKTGYKSFPGFPLINPQDTTFLMHAYESICLYAATQNWSMKEQSCLLLSRAHGTLWKRKLLEKHFPCPTALLGLWALAQTWIFGLLE